MNDSISYQQLETLLAQLGFRQSTLPSSNIMHRHESSDTFFVFPPHRPQERVPITSIIGTRKVLVDRGLIDAERWEEMVHTPAA